MKHLYFGRKAPPKPPNIEAGSILAAFPTAHPRGDDELEIRLVLDTLLLQGGNEFPGSFLIRYITLFLLFAGVLVSSPSRIRRQKTALHGIGEDSTKTGVDSFYGALGERFSGHRVLLFSKFSVETAEVFGF